MNNMSFTLGTKLITVPVRSEIAERLWMGGCQDNGEDLGSEFAYIVALTNSQYHRYKADFDTTVLRYDLKDTTHTAPNEKQIFDIAKIVSAFRSKGNTLVHCQAGLNRSGLVVGLSLMLDGWTAKDAIELMRKGRCEVVLCNERFEKWLLDYHHRIVRA